MPKIYKYHLGVNWSIGIIVSLYIDFLSVISLVDPGHNPSKFKFDICTPLYHDPYV